MSAEYSPVVLLAQVWDAVAVPPRARLVELPQCSDSRDTQKHFFIFRISLHPAGQARVGYAAAGCGFTSNAVSAGSGTLHCQVTHRYTNAGRGVGPPISTPSKVWGANTNRQDRM